MSDFDDNEFLLDLAVTGDVGDAMVLDGLETGDTTEVVEGELLGGGFGSRRGSGLGLGGLFAAEAITDEFSDQSGQPDQPSDSQDQSGVSFGNW